MKQLQIMLLIAFALYGCTHAHETKTPEELTMLQQMGIGAATGCTEVSINHPLFYLKNMSQQKKPISKNPLHWYRGFSVNFASMVPAIMIQVTVFSALQSPDLEQSEKEKIAKAIFAGISSSPVCCLSELFILQKQNALHPLSVPDIIRNVRANHGLKGFTRGLIPTAVREAGFAAGYLVLAPYLKARLKSHTNNDVAATLAGGIPAGIIASTATHLFDTVKTLMQRTAAQKEQASMLETARALYKQDGIKGFFRGFTPRATRAALAIPILAYTHQKYTEMLSAHSE